ncbi:MAG: hypothetical protein K6E95_00775 [Lachnospiraceae bacterium]|nr:hypothetical protein [Lachnospiraceae bacterium]
MEDTKETVKGETIEGTEETAGNSSAGSKSLKIAKILCAMGVCLVVFAALQRLVTPKYTEGDMAEGGLIASYYDSEKNHDVIFLGDCEVYENFDPEVIEKESGLKCYIRGSAQQLIWQSYYLLEDTLRYETPKAVVFNVLSLKYNEPQNEAYNRMTLEGMEWSTSKIAAINASMTEEESLVTYIFPILRYHDRIRNLSADDFKYFFESPKLTADGAYLREGVVPAEHVPEGKPLDSYEFGDNAWKYMEKIRTLCEENGIKLILIKAPSVYPFWYDEWDDEVSEYAEKNGLSYVNLLDRTLAGQTGVDFAKHTYDGGLHLNKEGAGELSRFFSAPLKTLVNTDTTIVDKKAPAAEIGQTGGADKEKNKDVDGVTDAGKDVDNNETQPSAPSDSKENSETDAYVFEYKGSSLVPGMKWDEKIRNELGEPISYFEAKSCVFEGIDRMYTYPGFEVDVSPDGSGGEAVSSVYLLDDSITTPEGAYIGCSGNMIETLYGEDETGKDDEAPDENANPEFGGTADDTNDRSLSYVKGGIKLKFIIKDNAVVSICYSISEE